MTESCPRCGWDGSSKFNAHVKQINPQNPHKWICGKCGESW